MRGDMQEEAKRLKPTLETLRELFLKSGNLCAFPNCSRLMMNAEGIFVGQVCHIEGAEAGGERFNPKMTNEQRRAASNLMLMCYDHHQITNDVHKYTVVALKKMKREHEERFASPDRAILERLTDWTTIDRPVGVKHLKRLNEVLKWNHTSEDLDECVSELNDYITKLSRVPVDVRHFIGVVAERMHRMGDTRAVQSDMFDVRIAVDDLRSALRISDSAVRKKMAQMETYGLGGVTQIDTDLGAQGALSIRSLQSGWPIWETIVEFCQITKCRVGTFSDDMNFSAFDSETPE